MSSDGADDVSVTVDVGDDRSVIRVVGTRDAAVVVAGPSTESIYLPPENFATAPADPDDASPGQTSYGTAAGESPYEGMGDEQGESGAPADSPYEAADGSSSVRADAEGVRSGAGDPGEGIPAGAGETVGLESTADGFEIVHPSPIHDVRILR